MAATVTLPVTDDILRSRRVVCAALRAADGDLLLGIRHYSRDMLMQMYARPDGHKFRHLTDINQGFVDNNGLFLTRREAYVVAELAGQIIDYAACSGKQILYSEALY